MTLEVIGAGFGRTGTASLKRALEILGFGPCYHMFVLQRAPWRARDWLPAIAQEQVKWSHVFRGYRSAVDWPTVSFTLELAKTYPQARIILTQRAPDSWYESTRDTLFALWRALPLWPRRLPFFGAIYAILDHIWRGTFEGRFENRARALEILAAHEERIIEGLPEQRLLLFQVAQGWAPLCAFLNVEPPNTPFPHVNERAEIAKMVRWVYAGKRMGPALLVGLIGLAFWGLTFL